MKRETTTNRERKKEDDIWKMKKNSSEKDCEKREKSTTNDSFPNVIIIIRSKTKGRKRRDEKTGRRFLKLEVRE